MSLSDKLKATAAEHATREATLRGGVDAHLDRIAVDVDAHAIQHLKNLLTSGVEEGLAIASAEAEAFRYRQHLVASVLKVADPDVKNVDLQCSQCGIVTAHSAVVDHNAETVCTCVCGRFRKFAPGVVPSDATE